MKAHVPPMGSKNRHKRENRDRSKGHVALHALRERRKFSATLSLLVQTGSACDIRSRSQPRESDSVAGISPDCSSNSMCIIWQLPAAPPGRRQYSGSPSSAVNCLARSRQMPVSEDARVLTGRLDIPRLLDGCRPGAAHPAGSRQCADHGADHQPKTRRIDPSRVSWRPFRSRTSRRCYRASLATQRGDQLVNRTLDDPSQAALLPDQLYQPLCIRAGRDESSL